MSPEQTEGKVVDAQSDIFTLQMWSILVHSLSRKSVLSGLQSSAK
jgi:hypothetical protein